MTTQGIEDIDPAISDEIEPLTTILAIKCSDGIVMASDSQSTLRVEKTKTLGVTKVFEVNNFMCVGGAGDADNVKLFVEHLTQQFPNISSSEIEFQDNIQKIFWRAHKKYNLDSREFLGNDACPFNPTLLVGAKNEDKSFGLYLLKNTMVYPQHEPVVIGSGGNLARLVIKILNRGMVVAGGSLHELPVEDVIGISCYIINEVKESDSHSGGETKVAVVGSNGVETLSQEKIQENFDRFLGIMAVGFAPLGLSEEDIKKIWLYGK